MVLGKGDVADVVVRFDSPVLAGQLSQVGGCRVGAGEIGDEVDRFAGDLLGARVSSRG
jgi:hypothetical protein